MQAENNENSEPLADPMAKYFSGLQKYTANKTTSQPNYFVQDERKKFDVQATANRFKYLLSITPLFKHFLEVKSKSDESFAKVLDIIENSPNHKPKSITADHRRRRTEKEEDAELLKTEEGELENEDNEGEYTDAGYEFVKSPAFINGLLRPYQIQGLNWLVSLNTNDLSGILADEMGLGKTLQTISFLGYLRYLKGIKGPHIVIVPKSTLENWQREFAKWTPEVRTCVLTGDQETRNKVIKESIQTKKFDVLISSYEIVIREKAALRKIDWQYIVVDEAHRLKNEDSLLSQIIRMFHSKNRLLITGTPLQNNLHELWALLNFLLPDIFNDSTTFDEWFSKDDGDENDENSEKGENDGNKNNENGEESDKVVQQLRQVLQPFLLRRIKNDVEKSLLPKQELNVYVGMTPMQRKWYQSILEKDIDAVNGANGKKESKTRLLNIVMQLRKCCNHPYLFEGAEPGPPYTTDEHLVYNSQKMLVLDKLLKRLREQGSRVLIFSQMSRMLDILEDYAAFREWGYCRIDGQTEHVDRISAIDEYNKPDSDKFLFLLTTRAGGLGINLTSADVVVLYDSDWNPQADLQAMDRAHRIGQKKQVKVFRFVTENAIEEKVLERASQKLRLDQLVIQQGRGISNEKKSNAANNKEELLNMIQHGAAEVLTSNINEGGDEDDNGSNKNHEIDDDELERILMKSNEKTGELKSKFSKLGLDDLQNFSSNNDSVYEWNGQNFQKKEFKGLGKEDGGFNWISLAKRERKVNYSVDGYYREALQTRGPTQNSHAIAESENDIKPPKHLNLYDHQFYNDELYALHELEWAYYKRVLKIPAKKEKHMSEEDVKLEQFIIDHARPLTETEKELKVKLLSEGFGNFTRRDFYTFINASAKHSRYDIKSIAMEFDDKTYDEIKEYAEKFWNNFRDIENYDRYIGQIEAGEDKLRKLHLQQEVLRNKVASYKYPMRDMEFKLPYTATSKKDWNDFEDRWLVIQMLRIGIEREDLYEAIWNEIKFGNSLTIELDVWLQSRNVQEIARRCQTLLGAIVREHETKLIQDAKKAAKKGKASSSRHKGGITKSLKSSTLVNGRDKGRGGGRGRGRGRGRSRGRGRGGRSRTRE